MAKGRKLTISRSERFLGGYSNGHGQDSNGNIDSSEFREEDVWSIIDNSREEHHGNLSVRPRRRNEHHAAGGVSLAFQDSGRSAAAATTTTPRGRHVAMSAPVNVPDWSKILRVDSVESLPEVDDVADGDESEMVPPHEYLAREYARSRNTAATSVFEGVGRTLKGRDLRRVRDAVWSQTGFDG